MHQGQAHFRIRHALLADRARIPFANVLARTKLLDIRITQSCAPENIRMKPPSFSKPHRYLLRQTQIGVSHPVPSANRRPLRRTVARQRGEAGIDKAHSCIALSLAANDLPGETAAKVAIDVERRAVLDFILSEPAGL